MPDAVPPDAELELPVRDWTEKAKHVAVEYHQRAVELRADGRFTEEGVRDRLQALALDYVEDDRIGNLRVLEERLEKRVNNLERELELPTRASDDAAGAVRDMEVRTWLRGLDPEERREAVFQVIEEGDGELMKAIATGPQALSGVRPDLREPARERWIESQHGPNALDRLEGHRQALASVREIRENALSVIAQLAPSRLPNGSRPREPPRSKLRSAESRTTLTPPYSRLILWIGRFGNRR